MSLEGAIAAHRFGLGARPGEIEAASTAPNDWLLRQLASPPDQPKPIDGGQPFKSGGELVAEIQELKKEKRAAKMQVTDMAGSDSDIGPKRRNPALKELKREKREDYQREMAARFALGFTTERPFAERLVWFWSNHFAPSSASKGTLPFIGAFEREAIRPYVTGKFEDMALASTRHPAMLIYLNNAKSIGPDSMLGKVNGKGLNENLGRELMELHTLGVDGGYTQADVIALAKILTGWSIDRWGGETGFRFYQVRHEPGAFVLRGKTYAGGEEAGITAIRDLARDPATARHIAGKFAAHFIGDDPPAESVARLEKSFNSTGGDLKALAQAVVDDRNAWKAAPAKMRSPVEYTTAAMRLLNWKMQSNGDQQVQEVMNATRMMGQFPLAAPSPKGWPDTSQAWSGPDALLNRIEWARQMGNRVPQSFDAMAAADASLGPLLHPTTRDGIRSSANQAEALALVVSSPEFQRR